ncbi:MAG: hypothetical protein WBB67_02190, partial [bacterium]
QRPIVCYMANMIKQDIHASLSIDYSDDLPFTEMIASIPKTDQVVDVIVVTPGGSAEQVARFVDRLRPRFKDVTFLLPSTTMSAGTIFCLSGNEIIMHSNAFIGPIDPQVPCKDGRYIPAQAILTLIEDIRTKGEELIKQGQNPAWTDLQILRQMDAKEIGNALSASRYSIELAENYLFTYKFRDWNTHSNGNPVTDGEKRKRAKEIAYRLCDHGVWKTHSRGITREAAWNICKIKVLHTENINDLDRAIRRFWALMYWIFDKTAVYKIFISDNYAIFRKDPVLSTKE